MHIPPDIKMAYQTFVGETVGQIFGAKHASFFIMEAPVRIKYESIIINLDGECHSLVQGLEVESVDELVRALRGHLQVEEATLCVQGALLTTLPTTSFFVAHAFSVCKGTMCCAFHSN
jgi:hypothetical protein